MGYKKAMTELFETLLNFIYPRNITCILCEEEIEKTDQYSLCDPCRSKIKFITSRYCDKCGKPLEPMYLPQKCPDCITTKHHYTKGFSCVEYDEEIKKLIYRLKYHKQRYLAYHMAEIIIDRLRKEALGTIDYILPIPLHKRKEKQRDFNQSYLVAKYVGEALEIPVEHKNILRAKETEIQNKLTKEERKKNLEGAFKISNPEQFRDKKILILDDIYTTGSTIDACSKEILKGRPKDIYFITFATGRTKRNV